RRNSPCSPPLSRSPVRDRRPDGPRVRRQSRRAASLRGATWWMPDPGSATRRAAGEPGQPRHLVARGRAELWLPLRALPFRACLPVLVQGGPRGAQVIVNFGIVAQTVLRLRQELDGVFIAPQSNSQATGGLVQFEPIR